MWSSYPSKRVKLTALPYCTFVSIIFKLASMRKLTQEEFIAKAREVHGDKYDYSLVEYVNYHTKVCIICKGCGEMFMQTPGGHLRGYGCRKCCLKKGENP